jgi:dinuclear metal center YbgI/SA1388 family protein
MADRTVDLEALVSYLDAYLESPGTPDFGPNGLQVEGRKEVRKVVTGVSACLELFERATAAGADAVLVHHGLFWDGQPSTLVGFRYRRVAELVRAGVSLIAYHLPLDRHPEVGNNALAARALGLVDLEPFAEHAGLPVGFRGRYEEPVPFQTFRDRCRKLFGQEPEVFAGGPERVARVGIVSGGAQREVYTAIGDGLDAFVTGEVSEWVMNVAREAGIHYLACGHYATERLGIRALGEKVAERFGVEVEFVDVPNPV